MNDAADTTPAVAEAVDWLVLLASGSATDADLRALDAWRRAAPENEGSFRLLQGVRPVGKAMAAQPAVSRRAVLGGGATALAGVAAFGLARPPLGLWPSFAELMADHRTGPGQRLALTPSAGVAMELNSRTSVSRLSAQDGMQLIEGEAFVAVARAQPFALQAGDAVVQARNAQFNLETLAGGVRLGCLEGEVRCTANGRSALIRAGGEWRLAANGTTAVGAAAPDSLAGWRNGTLRFDRAPLSEVVEQFNRYRSTPIVLASATVGQRPVSGYFYTSKTGAAVAQLQQLLGLNVRRLPGDVLLISG